MKYGFQIILILIFFTNVLRAQKKQSDSYTLINVDSLLKTEIPGAGLGYSISNVKFFANYADDAVSLGITVKTGLY